MKLPKEFISASVGKPKQLEAALDMSEQVAGIGLCPECKRPMEQTLIATDDQVWVCLQCRVTLPIKDENAKIEISDKTVDGRTPEDIAKAEGNGDAAGGAGDSESQDQSQDQDAEQNQ